MILVDSHIHTCFSTDSKMNISEAIQRANELGIGITITEHMDLSYPEPEAFIFDVNDYLQKYDQYRNDKLLLGIEIGMRPDCLADSAKIIKEHKLDYILGSIHIINNIDFSQANFYQNRSKQEVYRQYFATMLDCINIFEFIDSLAHIDYIARYSCYLDPEIYHKEFQEHIDQVLIALANQQKAIEINTRRLSDKAAIAALLTIYKRFNELGGRIATVGSDAHRADDIGRHFNIAEELAEASNLKIVYFKHHTPY